MLRNRVALVRRQYNFFFQALCKYVAMAILDTSKNDPITITGIATPVNTTDKPITL